jgi:phosphopentomutase
MGKLGEGDMLVITADHGCDPGDASTDHTREYTPLLVLGKGVNPVNLGTRKTFADIAATAAESFGVSAKIAGESFYKDITEAHNE